MKYLSQLEATRSTKDIASAHSTSQIFNRTTRTRWLALEKSWADVKFVGLTSTTIYWCSQLLNSNKWRFRCLGGLRQQRNDGAGCTTMLQRSESVESPGTYVTEWVSCSHFCLALCSLPRKNHCADNHHRGYQHSGAGYQNRRADNHRALVVITWRGRDAVTWSGCDKL